MFLTVKRAPPGSPKKYVAVFREEGRPDVRIGFGAHGAMDFIKWGKKAGPTVAAERRRAYLLRHARENWADPRSAGALSRWILWELPDFSAAVAAFVRRFGLQLAK